MEMLLKNARVVLPRGVTAPMSVALAAGRISAIGEALPLAGQVIDLEGD